VYYIIQRYREQRRRHFIAYKAPKYITSAASDTIILEFIIEGKKRRKWASKSDIILLTQDPEHYQKVLDSLRTIEARHLRAIQAAEAQVLQNEAALEQELNAEFEAIASSGHVDEDLTL